MIQHITKHGISNLRYRIVRTLLVTTTSIGIGTACVDVSALPQDPVAASDLLASVKISTSAVVMQRGETFMVSLHAWAMTGDVIPINDPTTVDWKSLDPEQVSIDSKGTIEACLTSTTAVSVIGTWTHRGVTMADTIPVYVTADRVEFTSIRMLALDSTRVGLGYFFFVLPPRVRIDLINNGTVVKEGVLVPVTVDKPMGVNLVGDIDGSGRLIYAVLNSKSVPGSFYVRAEGTVYGVSVKDSMEWTGLYPSYVFYSLTQEEFTNDVVSTEETADEILQLCGSALFTNGTNYPIDVIFDDSTAQSDCGEDPYPFPVHSTRNLLDIRPGQSKSRKFSTFGTRHWYVRHAESKALFPRATGVIYTKAPND